MTLSLQTIKILNKLENSIRNGKPVTKDDILKAKLIDNIETATMN